MYSNIQQAVASVQNAPGSIFTKDDVVKLLESIQLADEKSSPTLSAKKLEELVDDLNSKIKSGLECSDADELVDFDSAEYSVDGHYIQFDSIDVDIKVDFEDEIRDILTDFFKPEEEVEEEEEN
jgi:hypothetical protein